MSLVCFTMTILFRIIIQIFKFFGMWPISFNVSDNTAKAKHYCNKILIIWSIINILSLSAYIIVICVNYEVVLSKLNGIGTFSAAAKGGTVLLTHLVILLESLCTRKDQHGLWSKTKCVDRTFEKMDIATDVHNNKFYRNYSLKFFSYQLLAWISEIVVLYQIQNNLSWKLFNYATLLSVMVSRSRHLHHALYIGGYRRIRLSSSSTYPFDLQTCSPQIFAPLKVSWKCWPTRQRNQRKHLM